MASGSPLPPFSWLGWNYPNRSTVSAIRQQYGSSVANPNLGGSRVAAGDAKMIEDAGPRHLRDMTAAANTAQREQNAAATEVRANLAAARGNLGAIDPTDVTPSTVGGADTPVGVPAAAEGTGGYVNPNLGAASRVAAEWAAQGGSDATLHAAQRAAGIRPAIDARATKAWQDQGPSASEQIQAGWGGGYDPKTGEPLRDAAGHAPWTPSTFGNAGSALWAQMTQNFLSRKAKLRQSLSPGALPPGVAEDEAYGGGPIGTPSYPSDVDADTAFGGG